MSKDLSVEQFRSSLRRNLANQSFLSHSRKKQPNTSGPTDTSLYIRNARKNVEEFSRIVHRILDKK